MESWDRQKLYEEVWAKPVTKVAARYGVSDVMMAKVCRKLSIPLPGRGYWARLAAGQKITKTPLPKVKDVPVIYRYETVPESSAPQEPKPPVPEPTDPEYLRIRAVESSTITVDSFEGRHKLILAAEKRLSGAKVNSDGILEPRGSGPLLEIRVSPGALNRALTIMNAIILTLEAEKFPVALEGGLHGTKATVFGHAISFAIVEKLEVTGRHEVQEYSWSTKTVVDHAPTGKLELRADDFTYGPKFRDTKGAKLEAVLAQCVGGIMRVGRNAVIAAEQKRQSEIREREQQIERFKLAEEIRKEEEKVKELDAWVNSWSRAKEVRAFVDALEATWSVRGEDLTNESPKRKRLDWMRQYADWLDPLMAAPPWVLDRRHEVRYR